MARIRTGSRLHFGLFNLEAAPRRFGGVGLMIDLPGSHVTLTASEQWSAAGPLSSRVLEFARAYAQSSNRPITPGHFTIEQAAPEHSGLGTGTQLGLAVARLLAEAHGLETDSSELARRVGRGLRSALGIHGFAQGGFLVEAGKRSPDEVSPLVARIDFPEPWRVLVIIPPHLAGLQGAQEKAAFAHLRTQPFPSAQTDSLCRLTLLGMLPALAEQDAAGFGAALHEFNRRVGERFAPVQGGVYGNPQVSELVTYLLKEGVAGVGQSSWGPAVFAVVAEAAQATWLTERLRARYANDTLILVAQGLNHGADFSVS